jgi:ATP-dependent Clp protease ATP-binding subunit ClpB
LGSQYLIDLTMSPSEREANVMTVVRQTFKPEFLNRLDDIVMFDALQPNELAQIVRIQVASLADRLADRRIALQVSDAAVDWLARNGFDPIYGARPLRRLIQTSVGDQLARAVLRGDVVEGDTVVVELEGDELQVRAA